MGVDSDHMSLVVWIKGEGKKEGRRGKKRKGRWRWSDEGKRKFKEKLGEIQEREGGVEEEWGRMKARVVGIMEKGGKEGGIKEGRGSGWFEEECRETKIKVRKELRSWRKKGGRRYRELKGSYGKLCQRKRRQRRGE